MDLRTFVKPDRPPFVRLPEIGRPAPPLPGAPPALGRARIVAFLRHVGCPFAELTMKTLDQASVRHPEVQFLAVSHGTPAATRRWCAELQMGYGVMVIDDPAREVYAAWGLGLTSLRHFLGLRSVGRAMSLATRGIRNRHPSGNRWQQAGKARPPRLKRTIPPAGALWSAQASRTHVSRAKAVCADGNGREQAPGEGTRGSAI